MKTLVLGESGVGKSTLIHKIAERCEDGKYRMFFHSEEEPQSSKLVEVELVECTSSHFDSSVVGVIYVIDTTDRRSYEQVKQLHVPSCKNQAPRIKDLTLLISTKTDLHDLRQVSTEEVEEFAAGESLLTFECNIVTPRSYDVVSRMIRMKLPIKRLVQVRKFQQKPNNLLHQSSEKRTSAGDPATPMNKFSFESQQGTMASTQLPSQLFNYPNSLPPSFSSPFANQRLLRSGSRDQLKILTDEKSTRWNQNLRDHDETSDYRLNLEQSVMNGTQRDQNQLINDILSSSQMYRLPAEEEYKFVETGISQVLIRPKDIGGVGRQQPDPLSDSEILRKMDDDIAQMSTIAARRQRAEEGPAEEPYMLLKGETERFPSSMARQQEFQSGSEAPSAARPKNFESFKSGVNTPNQFQSAGRVCLMKVIVNKTDVSVFADDNSESIAKRYFDMVGTVPLRRDFLRLQTLIKEKVDKKIDYLEVMFKRPLLKLEQQRDAPHKPKTVSIDLSNKENKPPNIVGAVPKPPVNTSKLSGLTSKSGGSHDIPIPLKKDDDPEQLARVILIQRGLGLSRVAELADMIRRNQLRLFGSRGTRGHK